MQICRRSLEARQIDHETLWLLVSLGSFGLAALWFDLRLPTPQCVFHALTGLPCPTCGATRATWQFLHGHFAASFFYNPLVSLSLCFVLAFDLYALAALTGAAPRIAFTNFSATQKLLLRSLAIGLLLVNWLYLLTTRS